MTDLLTIAEAQIAEKQVKEIENIKKRLEEDKETIKRAIELVNAHTLYKQIDTGRFTHKYVLATEEMLRADYLKEPEGFSSYKGIRFLNDNYQKPYNTGILAVNGEIYYDIHFVIEAYEKGINEKAKALDTMLNKIRDLREEIEVLERNFPSLKQAIIEWQEYQKVNKTEDE